jgi:hypothetical protein
VIAIQVHRAGAVPAAAHASQLAAQIETAWHEATPLPLRFVGGDADISYGVAAAAADKPRALPGMRAPEDAQLAKAGMALVCFSEDLPCVHDAQTHASTGRHIESEIVRDYLGMPGKPQRYSIVIVAPKP